MADDLLAWPSAKCILGGRLLRVVSHRVMRFCLWMTHLDRKPLRVVLGRSESVEDRRVVVLLVTNVSKR